MMQMDCPSTVPPLAGFELRAKGRVIQVLGRLGGRGGKVHTHHGVQNRVGHALAAGRGNREPHGQTKDSQIVALPGRPKFMKSIAYPLSNNHES